MHVDLCLPQPFPGFPCREPGTANVGSDKGCDVQRSRKHKSSQNAEPPASDGGAQLPFPFVWVVVFRVHLDFFGGPARPGEVTPSPESGSSGTSVTGEG